MAMTAVQRVAKQRKLRVAQGWREVKFWVPSEADAEELRKLAAEKRRKHRETNGGRTSARSSSTGRLRNPMKHNLIKVPIPEDPDVAYKLAVVTKKNSTNNGLLVYAWPSPDAPGKWRFEHDDITWSEPIEHFQFVQEL